MKHPFTCGLGADQAVCLAIENGNCNLVSFCRVLNEQAKTPTALIRETGPSSVSHLPVEAKPADTADEMDASAHSQASWNAAGILASLGEMG